MKNSTVIFLASIYVAFILIIFALFVETPTTSFFLSLAAAFAAGIGFITRVISKITEGKEIKSWEEIHK